MNQIAIAREAVAPLIAKFNASQDKGQDVNALAISSFLAGKNQAGVIQVQVRNVYGNPLIYPVNQAAQLIANIAGTRTLSRANLATAQQLGFQIQEVPALQLVG